MVIGVRMRVFLFSGMTVWLLAACSIFPGHNLNNGDTLMVATRIKDGMQRLGASPARGECYANHVTRSLIESEAGEAANLIERALSKDEMRENVIAASTSVRQAFIKAHFGCSLSG
jgi:hypothetical protein